MTGYLSPYAEGLLLMPGILGATAAFEGDQVSIRADLAQAASLLSTHLELPAETRGQILRETASLFDGEDVAAVAGRLHRLVEGVGALPMSADLLGLQRIQAEPDEVEVLKNAAQVQDKIEPPKPMEQCRRMFDIADAFQREVRKRIILILRGERDWEETLRWAKEQTNWYDGLSDQIKRSLPEPWNRLYLVLFSSFTQALSGVRRVGYLEKVPAESLPRFLGLFLEEVKRPVILGDRKGFLTIQSRDELAFNFMHNLLLNEILPEWEGDRLVLVRPRQPSPFVEKVDSGLYYIGWPDSLEEDPSWNAILGILGWGVQVEQTAETIRLSIDLGKSFYDEVEEFRRTMEAVRPVFERALEKGSDKELPGERGAR